MRLKYKKMEAAKMLKLKCNKSLPIIGILSLFALLAPSDNCAGEGLDVTRIDTLSSCKTSEDCEFVNDPTHANGCCGCMQGGKAIAINKINVQAFSDELAKACAATMCIQVISNDPSCAPDAQAVCVEGQCEVR